MSAGPPTLTSACTRPAARCFSCSNNRAGGRVVPGVGVGAPQRVTGEGEPVGKGDRDVPYQQEAEAVEQAFRLVDLCSKSFRWAARQLAHIRLAHWHRSHEAAGAGESHQGDKGRVSSYKGIYSRTVRGRRSTAAGWTMPSARLASVRSCRASDSTIYDTSRGHGWAIPM